MTIGLILLVIGMFGSTALAAGGYTLIRRGTDTKRGWLMIVAAAVVIGNILILTV